MCNPLWQSHSRRFRLPSKNVPFCIVSQNPPDILANLSAGQPSWLVATPPLVSMLTAKIPKNVLLYICNERVLQWTNPRYTFPYSFTAISSPYVPCDVASPDHGQFQSNDALFCLSVFAWNAHQAYWCLVHVYSVFLTQFKHQLLCEVLPNSHPFPQHRLALVHPF